MSDNLVTLTDDTFESEINKGEGGPILVDFWATWCGPCRMVAPILEEIATEMNGKARIGKLDIDQNPGTASQYGVMSIPTLLLFKNGQQVDKIIGAASKTQITEMIDRHA